LLGRFEARGFGLDQMRSRSNRTGVVKPVGVGSELGGDTRVDVGDGYLCIRYNGAAGINHRTVDIAGRDCCLTSQNGGQKERNCQRIYYENQSLLLNQTISWNPHAPSPFCMQVEKKREPTPTAAHEMWCQMKSSRFVYHSCDSAHGRRKNSPIAEELPMHRDTMVRDSTLHH